MDYLTPTAISGLISVAARNAAQAGLPAAEGGAFVLLMMSSFGHRVCADPLHPWLSKELADQPGEGSSAKMDRLLSRTKTYLAMMIRQLREGRR